MQAREPKEIKKFLLLKAVEGNQLNTIKSIITPDFEFPEAKDSILHAAVDLDKPEAIRVLIMRNAPVQIKDGRNPIQYAAFKNRWSCVDVFIEFAKVNASLFDGVVLCAVKANHVARVTSLLEAKADLDPTSLHEAVRNENPDMVKLLLRFNANPKSLNKDGKSPIEYEFASSYQLELQKRKLLGYQEDLKKGYTRKERITECKEEIEQYEQSEKNHWACINLLLPFYNNQPAAASQITSSQSPSSTVSVTTVGMFKELPPPYETTTRTLGKSQKSSKSCTIL